MRSARAWITALILLLSVAGVLGRFAFARAPGPRESARLSTLWPVPRFSFPDQHGATITDSVLSGRVWIADFMFTRCTSVCPMLTARLRLLQRRLPDESLRFVSFSVDPEHDSTEALRQYAETWAKDEQRWHLLRSEPVALEALVDGMRVVAEPSGDPSNPILHTSLFFLVDRAGVVRGMYDSNEDLALSRLVEDAQALLAAAPSLQPSRPSDDLGRAQYEQLGCAGCHDDPRLAPNLRGIWDREVTLSDGTTARVDSAYLRESILAPTAKRVSGYLDTMPSYANALSGAELDALVAHVQGKAKDSSFVADSTAPASLARDPVCGMSLRVSTDTPHAERDGHDYYFCSESCRERFVSGHSH